MESPHNLSLLSDSLVIDEVSHYKELIAAHRELALLDGACIGLPNPSLLLSPTVLREALASSEIEGVITTLADVLQAQLFPESEQTSSDKEVLRYGKALRIGENSLDAYSFSNRTILAIHDILLPDQKGYRKTQNGLRDSRTGKIVYTPPSAAKIPAYIADLEKFMHTAGFDPLLKAVIAHYQFEAIHPFGDGNGRTGRILLVLGLKHFELLRLPVLFVSGFINAHKKGYYEAIRGITEAGDWDTFISYMLEAVAAQAHESTMMLIEIKELHEQLKRAIRAGLPKIYSRDLIDTIFSTPFITATRYKDLLGVSFATASSHLRKLQTAGFMASFKTGKYLLYVNTPLMNLLQNRGEAS